VDRTYKKGHALHPLVCFDAASGAAQPVLLEQRLGQFDAGSDGGNPAAKRVCYRFLTIPALVGHRRSATGGQAA
jgi:hypothetical protein